MVCFFICILQNSNEHLLTLILLKVCGHVRINILFARPNAILKLWGQISWLASNLSPNLADDSPIKFSLDRLIFIGNYCRQVSNSFTLCSRSQSCTSIRNHKIGNGCQSAHYTWMICRWQPARNLKICNGRQSAHYTGMDVVGSLPDHCAICRQSSAVVFTKTQPYKFLLLYAT